MTRLYVLKTEFTDHGDSIPLRMLTSSNVRLFFLGGFAFFLYILLYYCLYYYIFFTSVILNTLSV